MTTLPLLDSTTPNASTSEFTSSSDGPTTVFSLSDSTSSASTANVSTTTDLDSLEIVATFDGDSMLWSMIFASIGVAIVYIVFACSFFVYIHAVHRKKTLKPWMKRNASRLDRGNSGSGKTAIEMIDIKINSAVSSKRDSREAAGSDATRMAVGRLRVCREIITTEASYVKVIDQIVDFYLARLEKALKFDAVLPKSDIDVIFRHCLALQRLHQTLLEKIDLRALEIKNEAKAAAHAASRRGSGLRSTPRDEELATQAILELESLDFVFDVFDEMIPFFRAYTAFCNNFDVAQAKIHQCLQANPKFQKFLERCRNDPDFTGLDLEDLLIQPVQRICRYPLLFDEALKNMLTSHPQFAKLTAVNEAMKGIAAEVDKARDIANNTKILHALHNDVIDSRVRPLKFSDTDFIIPSRWFIRRFDAQFEDRFEPKKLQPCSLFIFNDLVLLTTQKVLPRRESAEVNDRDHIQLVAEYTLPMSGLKCTPVTRKPATNVDGITDQDWNQMSELRFTGSVNMKSRTAVFKFSLVLSRELEAQMLLELLGELQSINHRNEAKKSELGSIGKKSWVRQRKQEYLDNRADTTEANADTNNSVYVGSSRGLDVASSLKALRAKYNKHVDDVYDDAVNTPRGLVGSANEESDDEAAPTSPSKQRVSSSDNGAGDTASIHTVTEGRPQPAVPSSKRPSRPQPSIPGSKQPGGGRGGGLDSTVVSALRTILNDPYLNGCADGTERDVQYLAVRNAIQDRIGRELTTREKKDLHQELANRRLALTAPQSYADKV